jgi:hypothetical protein
MKYKDNKFVNYQDRQRDGDFDTCWKRVSSRQIRREKEHNRSVFYMSKISNHIEKIWWKNLSDSDKDEIIRRYSNQLDYLSYDLKIRESMWYNYKVFDTWEDWFDQIKDEYKPNKVSYREDKLKVLGL